MTFSNRCDPSQLLMISSLRIFRVKVVADKDSFDFLVDLTDTKPEFSRTVIKSLNSGFVTWVNPFDLQIWE